ncbi:MAG: zinc-ribbon domain containing protein [Arenicella sp.]
MGIKAKRKRERSCRRNYVDHPRFGKQPIYSGARYTEDEIRSAHWRYRDESFFPETAIRADTTKQNISMSAITIYVDIEKQCRDCNRWFLFFAQEQKFWFEELQFYVDVTCVKCIECRKKEQSIKHRMHQYEALVKNENRTAKETLELKQLALELFQLGYIKNKHKLDRF